MATVKIFSNYLRFPIICLAIVESFIFLIAACTASLVIFQVNELNQLYISFYNNLSRIALIALIYTCVMMLSMISLGHYKSRQHAIPTLFSETVFRVLVSLFIGSILLMLIFKVLPEINIGGEFQLISAGISFFGIIFIRTIFTRSVEKKMSKRNVLVIGAGRRAQTLITETGGAQDGISYTVVGYISIENERILVPTDKVLNVESEKIAEFAMINKVDEIILAIEDRRKTYPEEELLTCKLSGIRIMDPVSFLEREQGKVNLEMLHSGWMIYSSGFCRNEMKNVFSRIFDVVSSLTILIIMFPVLMLTAILISAESGFKHPVFYRQKRVGLNGKTFSLLKFRSMKINAEKDGEAVWADKNDTRITLTGRFIRKTRIDELPQILNILKGDMRLVGPRPERPEFVENLSIKIPYYKKRHSVKPGLAGWAQLKYPYGATEQDAYEKLQYDLYYVKNNNLIFDFFILLQTIEIVIMGKGAR